MTSTKYKAHIALYLDRAMIEECQRLADDELIDRAAWMKRAILNDIQRIRKARDEGKWQMPKPPRRGVRAKTLKE